MKAIILAAGQGTRLLPFTREHPKCLVPVGGKAILDYQLDALRAAGVADALVIGGYRIDRLAEHVAALPADRRPALACNPFWSVANSIGSVWTARDQLREPFCLINGDTILPPELIAAALRDARPGVNLVIEPAAEASLDDMRVAVTDDRVTAVGKDLGPDATHRSLGLILALGEAGPPAYARALEEVICAQGGAQRFHHAVIDHLCRDFPVGAVLAKGPRWAEIDRPEDIARWQDPSSQ